MKPNYRRCLSCRKVAPKQAFWRVVRVHPSRKVQLDEGMGRSAYLCPNGTCLGTAQKKNRLGRSLRASIPEHLYKTLWQRLTAIADTPKAESLSKEHNQSRSNIFGEQQ